MKTFDDLVFGDHVNWPSCKWATMFFDNGYGISVVGWKAGKSGSGGGGFGGPYAGPGQFEAAVLIGKNAEDFSLTYDTDITDDVLARQSQSDITDAMRRIQELPKVSWLVD